MDDRLSRIVTDMIGTERSRRVVPVQAALREVLDKYTIAHALGHGRLPVEQERVCAAEYEERARLWLGIVRRVFAETDEPWTPEAAERVTALLADELAADWNGLLDAYREKLAGQTPPHRSGALDTAKDRAAAHLRQELALSVRAQDRTRIPVTEQLRAPRYAAVHDGWVKAHDLLRGSPSDPSNAAKEAVGAVEQLARLVTASPKAKLGDCIKALQKAGRIRRPLLKGIEELWGWASGQPGVRHGSGGITPAEAQYVLTMAEAALRLLLSVDVP
jgi:hypothetical protein